MEGAISSDTNFEPASSCIWGLRKLGSSSLLYAKKFESLSVVQRFLEKASMCAFKSKVRLGQPVKGVCQEAGTSVGRAVYVGRKAGHFSLRQAFHKGKSGFERD